MVSPSELSLSSVLSLPLPCICPAALCLHCMKDEGRLRGGRQEPLVHFGLTCTGGWTDTREPKTKPGSPWSRGAGNRPSQSLDFHADFLLWYRGDFPDCASTSLSAGGHSAMLPGCVSVESFHCCVFTACSVWGRDPASTLHTCELILKTWK